MSFNQAASNNWAKKEGQGNPVLLFESKSTACLINRLTFYMELEVAIHLSSNQIMRYPVTTSQF